MMEANRSFEFVRGLGLWLGYEWMNKYGPSGILYITVLHIMAYENSDFYMLYIWTKLKHTMCI